jgi:hypothetical protein
VDETYQRFMINRFREKLPFDEVPIKLIIRGKTARDTAPEGVNLDTADTTRPSSRPKSPARPKSKPSARKRPELKPHPKAASRTGSKGARKR